MSSKYYQDHRQERAKRDLKIYRYWAAHKDQMSQNEIGKRFQMSRRNIGHIIRKHLELELAEEAERR